MQTQAKSKIDAILKNIEQLGRIELDNIAIVACHLSPTCNYTKTQSRGDRWYERRETKEEAKCQEYIS